VVTRPPLPALSHTSAHTHTHAHTRTSIRARIRLARWVRCWCWSSSWQSVLPPRAAHEGRWKAQGGASVPPAAHCRTASAAVLCVTVSMAVSTSMSVTVSQKRHTRDIVVVIVRAQVLCPHLRGDAAAVHQENTTCTVRKLPVSGSTRSCPLFPHITKMYGIHRPLPLRALKL